MGDAGILAAGLVGGAAWALVQRRSPSALFDVKLLKKPYFTTAWLVGGLFGAVDAALLLLVSYYTQTPAEAGYGLGMDALGTGLVMMPFALMMFVRGKAAEKAVQDGRPGSTLVVGAAICAGGLLLLAFAHSSVWQYVAGVALVGLGSRLGYSGAFAITQLVVPESEAGMAGGMSGTTMAIGYAFGSAVITGLLALAPLGDTGLPQPYLYTVGYLVTLGFSVLILVSTLVSRLRYRGDFRDLLVQV
jgi:MFS family permease